MELYGLWYCNRLPNLISSEVTCSAFYWWAACTHHQHLFNYKLYRVELGWVENVRGKDLCHKLGKSNRMKKKRRANSLIFKYNRVWLKHSWRKKEKNVYKIFSKNNLHINIVTSSSLQPPRNAPSPFWLGRMVWLFQLMVSLIFI